MRPDRMAGSPPRNRRRLGFEGLEGRELLAAVLGPTTAPGFDSGTSPLPSFPSGLRPDPSLVPQFEARAFATTTTAAPSAYAVKPADILDAEPTSTDPTPAEVAREYFVAKFQGTYTIGPGRFSGQALTIHASSRVEGGSNQFLKGKAQLLLSTPVDPTTGQTTGLVTLFAQNYLQSGSSVIIDVGRTDQPGVTPIQTGGPTILSGVGGLQLPTQAPWAFDDTSAGAYTAPAQFVQGGGELSIVYTPDKTPKAGTLGSGKVVFLLQGLLDNSSILNVVDKGIN